MAINRRTHALPIPGSELQRMKEYLAPDYGSEVWTEGERRILVVRVPRPEPDLVNDIEAAVEYLSPGDVQGIEQALLIGSERLHAVSPQPFQDLMADRVRFDLTQGKELRARLPAGKASHLLYKAPNDPRKVSRLAIRVNRPNVRDLDDADLAAITEDVGPHLEEPRYKAIRAVYLVGDADDVRIDADLFMEDLLRRWGEESTRRALAAQIVAREKAEKARQEADRQKVLAEMEARKPRVAYAPLKTPAPAATWEAEGAARPAAAAAGAPGPMEAQRARMYAWVDSLPALASASTASASTAATYPPPRESAPPSAPVLLAPQAPAGPAPSPQPDSVLPQPPVVEEPPAAPPAPRNPPGLDGLEAALRKAGFDVMLHPAVPDHPLHLAAEREAGDPQRLVARCAPKMTDAIAQEMLAAARELDVDLALCVAEAADPEARKRIIATKVRLVAPGELDHLRL